MKKAIYPGTFNPIHKGHLRIIEKASLIFDKLYVVITHNPEKEVHTSFDKRFFLVKEMTKHLKGVEVLINKNQGTADFTRNLGVNFLIRSARNNTDFRYELELAAGNHHLNKKLETILIIPDYVDIEYESRLIHQGIVKK